MDAKVDFVIGRCIRLKSKTLVLLFVLSGVLLVPNFLFAQEETSISDRFDINLDLKNMHMWHGGIVTPGVMMASAMEYNSANRNFTAGLWGGASFDGDYKEFSYYTKYSFSHNLNLSLISHNNYSSSEDVNIFSYDKYTSPNFVDAVLEFTLSEKVPLTLYWSTILFGNGGDFEIDDDGLVSDSYSNYVELRYQFFSKMKKQLSVFVGGSFSFVTEKTFYSEASNLTNLGLTLSQEVDFISKIFPVSASAFWNPESKIGALQLGITLF